MSLRKTKKELPMSVVSLRVLGLLAVATLPAVASAEAILRLACFDANEGAMITVNGVRKGECPLDLALPAGTLVIRARKQPDAQHEQLWEKTLELADGAVKRVEIVLSAPQLTAEARGAQERQAQEKAAADFRADLQAAQGGDEAAIGRVITHYDAIKGVREATYWRGRLEAAHTARAMTAANAGAPDAMDDLASRYEQGLGIEKDAAKAAEWRSKAAAARQHQQAEQKRKMLIKERDSISFVGCTKSVIEQANDIAAGKRNDISTPVTMSTLGYLYIPVWLALDATSAPTRITDLMKVNKELEGLALRPAAWGNPDSLLAQAARQASAAQ